MSQEPAKHEFRAEVRKVLNIITHSLYTNREIFLRELISNASDALDKARYMQNKGEQLREPELPLEISISLDKVNNTLTVADTGIGMTRDELVANLGTIAKSGSEEFLAKMPEEAKGGGAVDATSIIGRFGVGFYSVFMVADKVEVTSRYGLGDAAAYRWTSDGEGSFTVEEAPDADIGRGTVIRAWLKEDAKEFLEKYRLDSVIRKHSSFISFPVMVEKERANTTPALWREPRFAVTKEQYAEFYKFLTYDHKEPLDTLHLFVDAPVQFMALMFIPDGESNFFGTGRDQWGLDLYARRVLIQRENKELIPEYLAFLKGVVDTEDLPLNISRETLQENVVLRKISQTITKQALGHLEKMAKDPAAYAAFWKLHGQVFKLGYHDYVNRERVAGLLRFNSSSCEDENGLISLDDYIADTKEGQKEIWYLSAPGREAAKLNPHMEVFRKKGLNVLFLYEPLDEFVMEGLGAYKEFSFKAVEHAQNDILDKFASAEKDDKPTEPPLTGDELGKFDALLQKMKEVLGDKVKDVLVSHRLEDTPACLVSPDGGLTSSMQKLMRVMQKDDALPVKNMEVNRDHPLLRNLLRIHKANPDDPILIEMIQGLFDTSLLMDGYIKDPQTLAARTNTFMAHAGAWYSELRKL